MGTYQFNGRRLEVRGSLVASLPRLLTTLGAAERTVFWSRFRISWAPRPRPSFSSGGSDSFRLSHELLLEAVGCPKTWKNIARSSGTLFCATDLAIGAVERIEAASSFRKRLPEAAMARAEGGEGGRLKAEVVAGC